MKNEIMSRLISCRLQHLAGKKFADTFVSQQARLIIKTLNWGGEGGAQRSEREQMCKAARRHLRLSKDKTSL